MNRIRDYLVSVFRGFKYRFRITGRGFYIYYRNNVVYFKLAFSHAVRSVLILDLKKEKKKKKKKKFFIMKGRLKKKLGDKARGIRTLRGPHLYSKRPKGIHIRREFVPRGIHKISKF